jgi:PKD repeat protein
MQNDRGNLSIDFLAGFTIFMISLIWVATMIPGILIGVQTRTIDVDAISYRTGVILTEDPGMPISPPWENKNDYQKSEVERFGLAASKDTPNILKMAKIERFFCSTSFSYPTDYKNRLIFGDRPYGFNITLSTFDGELTRSLGDLKPEEYGYIRRLVKIKYPSNTTIDAQTLKNSANVTQHVFSIQLNITELIGNEPNYMYQINPRRDQIMVNFTNLSGARVFTPATNRITLNSIDIYRRNPLPPYTYSKVTTYANDDPKFQGYVDGSGVTATLPSLVNDNVSVIFSSGYFYGMADDYSTLRISYTFNLTDPDNFFNNSFTSPYSYNYSPAHVTQPRLKEGVLEVATWTAPFGSYAPSLITATPTPVQPPTADFYGTPRTGGKPLLVAFTDMTTGVPTTWNWTFGDIGAGNTSTLQNPTHTYTKVGSYSVNLTVSNVYGRNTLIKTNYIAVGLSIPIPAFTGTPLSGTAPLAVSFADASLNSPTIWNWTFGDIGAGNTSALQNPSHTYTKTGRYSVNLTAFNTDGNATLIKTDYITVDPTTPWKCDVTGWNYRKNITTIRTKASGTNNDFPLLISLASDADLAARARSDGYDIFFTASDGTTKLPHEIDNFTKSNGALVAWVKVPTISSSTNTTIFMYYGCATATDQQDKNNVWDANYHGVWHLNQGTGVTAVDSTSNANSATPVDNPAASTGQIGSALTFASPDRLTIPAAASLDLTTYSYWTMSAWVKPTSYAGTKWPTIYTYGDYRASMGLTVQEAGSDGLIENWINDATLQQSTNPVTLNAWNYVTITRTATTTSFYLNGNADGSSGVTEVTTGGQASTIGNFATRVVDEAFKGTIDEVRLSASSTSSGARSYDWIVTEYRNQNSPSTFYSVSSEESWSCTGSTPTPTPTPTTATPTPTPTPTGPWYCGWWFRKNITIQHAQVSGTNGNFPVLINLGSDADLAARALTNGNDILFTQSDMVTKIPHQIESYSSVNGALVAWVKVPSVSSSTDTTIAMYYGNAAAADQQDVTNVWDSNFKGVWHLNQGTGVTAVDSTSNANGAVPNGGNPTASTGQIGGALTFASPSRLVIPAAASTDLTTYSYWTMSAWVKPTSYAGTKWPTIYTYGDYRASMGLTVQEAGSDGLIENWINDATLQQSTNPVTLNAWNYVTITRTATTTSFYLNGNADGSSGVTAVTTAGQVSGIGADGNGAIDVAEQYLGLIDEVRLSASSTTASARSADWILTEYRNQNSPATFYSLNSQQQGTC